MNHLASEKSPYLLQHARNPVDWYSWSEAAFSRARDEDRPIFLSVGYSTCHWCHVMERESFEDPVIADLLNRHFVSIKVDREERPDVDRVYMTFVQATTGSGGWPMSVWLTPDLRPFYGGTYFPPSASWGRPGLVDILREIARVWREERDRFVASAATIADRLRALGQGPASRSTPGDEELTHAVAELGEAFDHRRGGFGSAPKFPRPAELLFLLREHARTGNPAARAMALQTLRAMASGGMRDHIGGGFHRYSVDAEWRLPHFEKMLYDQAQLVLAYLEASQLSGDRFYLSVAEDTLGYVLRDMSDPAGGFYSAEDADSVPPEETGTPGQKAEGAFYLWTDREIGERLGEDAEVVCLRFGVEPAGSAPHDSLGEFAGKNILYAARTIDEVARLTGRTPQEVEARLDRARDLLLAVRSRRPRPRLDDKILTAWNGLMIAALARAARVVGADTSPGAARKSADYLRAAGRAATFLFGTLWDGERRLLLRRYRDGEAAIEGYAEDYAFLIFGLLELFQASGDPQWLERAILLQEGQDERFSDPVEGGWFSTSGDDPHLLLRVKEDYDGAEPTASSVAVLNLLALEHVTGNEAHARTIDASFRLFSSRMQAMSRAVPMMLAALSARTAGVQQIVIVGDPVAEDTCRLVAAADSRYLPFAVLVKVAPGETQQRLGRASPLIAAMGLRDGRATAYVCRDFACREPTSDALRLGQMLDGRQ